jgi:hypothetical protein
MFAVVLSVTSLTFCLTVPVYASTENTWTAQASNAKVVPLAFDYSSLGFSYGGNFSVNNPPTISFSIANGVTLYSLGHFNVAFTTAIGSPESLQSFGISLYSVSYQASWEGKKTTQVYHWSINNPANLSDDDPNPQGGFFYAIDLTHVPQGLQQVEVTAIGGGYIFGGNTFYTFSSNASSSISFNISAPPSPTPTQTNSYWNLQTVGANGAGGVGDLGTCPIAVDSNEIPHVAYTASGSLVDYATWNGIGWSTQSVDTGYLYSLELDRNDVPHLVYGGSVGLMYATATGSNWTTQTVDPSGASFATLAFDSTGNAHVAYDNGTTIRYASWTGSNWQIQTVDTVNASYAVPFQMSLALDQINTPYLLYGYSPSDNEVVVKLAIGNDAGWGLQTISLPTPIAGYGNLILDSKAYPHFISAQNTLLTNNTMVNTLFYVSWNGTGWSTQTVASDVPLLINGPDTNWVVIGSFALDSHDYPHITFTTNDGKVMYASWTGNSWNIESVEGNNLATKPAFVVLDSSGNPHISFQGSVVSYYGYADLYSIVNIMYATKLMNSATTPSPIVPTLLIVAVTVTVVAVAAVGLLVYFKKRKR